METSREIRKEEMNHNLSPVKVCKQKADRGFGTLLPKFKEKGIKRYPIISLLTDLIKDWQPSKKPLNWYDCPELSRNINKKWEIRKWQDWIAFNRPIN